MRFVKNKFGVTYSSNDFRKFIEVIVVFTLLFGVGFLVYFVISKSFYGFQKFLYGKHGEIVIGSNTAMIPGLLLIMVTSYFLIIALLNILKKYFLPFFNFVNVKNSDFGIDKRFLNKLNNLVVALVPFSVFFMVICFNAYIALGSNYIAASSAAILNNRKDYSYSDIRLSKEIHRSGATQSWTYIYEFPDGKELSNLGGIFGSDIKVIKQIQERQRQLGVNISEVSIRHPKRKEGTISTFLSYLIFGLMFFFIPFTLNKLFRKPISKIKKDAS